MKIKLIKTFSTGLVLLLASSAVQVNAGNCEEVWYAAPADEAADAGNCVEVTYPSGSTGCYMGSDGCSRNWYSSMYGCTEIIGGTIYDCVPDGTKNVTAKNLMTRCVRQQDESCGCDEEGWTVIASAVITIDKYKNVKGCGA